MLRMFSNFSYSKLGLKCTLRQNVCHMDGVGSAGQGYTIVDGSGLPRITVVGFSRRVDWPVLVARLKAVTQGQMRSEEHTSELQSLMRISYAVFCLKKKKQ